MSTAELKYQLIELISTVNDSKALKEIYKLLSSVSKEENNDAKIASIKRGLAQIQSGHTVSHKEAKKIYQKWL